MVTRYGKADTAATVERPGRWRLLGVLCTAQFLQVLNFQTIALAVPLLARAFALDAQTVQWVISAYELAFGGLLLLAGRLADLFGPRRMFLLGLGLYAAAAVGCGLAPTAAVLIAARGVQGIAVALFTPAALALLSVGFAEGPARTHALGIWGAVGPLGGMVGIVLGGLLAGLGWAWVFWLTVPIAALAFVAAQRVLPPAPRSGTRPPLDAAGALVGTAGIVTLTWALTQLQQASRAALGGLALALALMALFVAIERRAQAPLVPGTLVRARAVVRANLLTLLHAATTNTPIFFFALYLQQVHGASAFTTGVAYLPANVAIIAGAALGSRLIERAGPRAPAMGGMALVALGLLIFSTLEVATGYLATLLPGSLLLGLGLGMAAVAVNVAGSSGVGDDLHGSAWGLLNTSARVGTAVGLALLVAIAASVTTAQASDATPAPEALIAGWRLAFRAGAGLAVVGLVLAALLPGRSTPGVDEARSR